MFDSDVFHEYFSLSLDYETAETPFLFYEKSITFVSIQNEAHPGCFLLWCGVCKKLYYLLRCKVLNKCVTYKYYNRMNVSHAICDFYFDDSKTVTKE